MRVVYVTSGLPTGPGEAFTIPEVRRLIDLGHDIVLVPTRPRVGIVHSECESFAARAQIHSLVSPRVLVAAFAEIVTAPRAVLRAVLPVARSRGPRKLLKNLVVLPKALWLARWSRHYGADHIHATWLSTPATVAMVAAEIAQIPWSATGHRWDIEEDNLLPEKGRRAVFLRVISQRGRAALFERGGSEGRVRVIRVGIDVPDRPSQRLDSRKLLVAGNLIPVKGHRFLVDALAILRRSGHAVRLDVAGAGPLQAELERQVERSGLRDATKFLGQLSHEQLLRKLADGTWGMVVVPSIVEPDGATEGVPVIIAEAMARGVPVVATDVGAISELGRDGAALLVAPRDPASLARAIERLVLNVDEQDEMVSIAYDRVSSEFDVVRTVDALIAEFAMGVAPGSYEDAVTMPSAVLLRSE
jgi:glycosyltransferase involved in cell wall biosynthesis